MKYRNILIGMVLVAGTYTIMCFLAKKYSEDDSINDDNPYLKMVVPTQNKELGKAKMIDKKSAVGIQENRQNLYVNTVKPALDKIISFCGLVVLSPLFGAIALAIKIDDPGSVFFTQKRIGKNKTYFMCHKFRSMKMTTPHNVPTHQLSNPDQYITRVGKVLRRTSMDELPQIWDIFRGRMSVIGPRPALWNQDDLVTERDKYGANDVMPGLTGHAQIKGRDELEIVDKAKLDGEYTSYISIGMDAKCFFETIISVLKSDGVVEGGTGEMKRQEKNK